MLKMKKVFWSYIGDKRKTKVDVGSLLNETGTRLPKAWKRMMECLLCLNLY